MKKLLALVVALMFAAGFAGVAVAQTPTPAPADNMADKPAAMKMKKTPLRNANGTVKTASADSIVVAGKARNKEVEWTFAVDPKTSIRRGSKSITAADLKPGDSVHVRYTDMDGKAVAQSIMAKGGGMMKKEAKTEKK